MLSEGIHLLVNTENGLLLKQAATGGKLYFEQGLVSYVELSCFGLAAEGSATERLRLQICRPLLRVIGHAV
jgi:hypothetical protein